MYGRLNKEKNPKGSEFKVKLFNLATKTMCEIKTPLSKSLRCMHRLPEDHDAAKSNK